MRMVITYHENGASELLIATDRGRGIGREEGTVGGGRPVTSSSSIILKAKACILVETAKYIACSNDALRT